MPFNIYTIGRIRDPLIVRTRSLNDRTAVTHVNLNTYIYELIPILVCIVSLQEPEVRKWAFLMNISLNYIIDTNPLCRTVMR
jgi:hypothetical protein